MLPKAGRGGRQAEQGFGRGTLATTSDRHVSLRYGVALLSIIAAVGALWFMERDLAAAAHVSLFLIAVLISTWFGGAKPGILAIVLSGLAFAYFFLPPIHSFAVETSHIPRLLLFAVLAIFVMWLVPAERAAVESLRRSKDELRRNNETLRESQQLLRLVLETLPVGVAVMNATGNISLINEASKRIWGGMIATGRERWEQTTGYWHKSGQRIDPAEWASMRALSKGEISLNELLDIETYDGQRKIIRNSAAPVRNAEGTIVGAVIVNEDVTDRVRGEEALKESETKLRQAQELAQIGYWQRDLITESSTWSEETYKIFGVRSPKLSEAELQALIHPDDRQLHKQAFQQALEGNRLYDAEYRIIRPDGSIRFVHVRDEIEHDETGEPIRMFGAVQDITDRKRAEEALRRSEDELRRVIDTVPVMAWTLRPDGVVDFLNRRWIDYAGLTLEQFVADPTGPIHPEDTPRVTERWRAQMERGEGHDDEMRLCRADGEYRWFLIRTAPLRDEHGNIVKWYGISLDIEDRKQMEEQLRRAEYEARRVIDAIPQQIWSGPADGTLDYCNYQWRTQMGIGLEQLQGDGWRQMLHPDDKERVLRAWKESVENGTPYGQEERHLGANGEYRWFLCRGLPLKNADGRIERWYGANTDITEQKNAEQALAEANRRLRILSRRRVQIQEEERRRLARELHDQIGQLLTAAKINVQSGQALSKDSGLNSKLADTVGILESVLQQVRKISFALRPPVLDDLGLAPALRWMLSETAGSAGLAAEFFADSNLHRADAESETACYRVAVEAVTNSISHAGAHKITMELRNVDHSIVLRVRDDGQGFDAAKIQRAAVRDQLGLSGMRERTFAVGGHFEIQSEPGKGTEVVARFPLSAAPDSTA
ncbi:MAG: PAS domain S-box protein [Chthoniobacterales bacterium]